MTSIATATVEVKADLTPLIEQFQAVVDALKQVQGTATTSEPAEPRVWQRVGDIPVGVRFSDRDGQTWFHENDWHRQERVAARFLDHFAPFTEVVDGAVARPGADNSVGGVE